jgi:autotransporter-associated beta strand protein
MKPTTHISQRNFVLSSRHRNRALATAFVTALASAAAPMSQAATFTWNGAGSGTNWSTGGNWGGTAPANTGSDTLRFGGNTNLVTNNDFTGLSVVASGGSAIGFTNTTNVGAGAFTLGGNAITLGGSIVTTAMTTGSLTDIINLQLNVAATRTVTTQANHNLTINGLINETTAGSGGITKTGGATLTLANASNNFTALTVSQGTLSVNSIAASGSASAIGAGNTITLGGGTTEGIFTFTGTNSLLASTNRAINLAESTVGGRINSNGTVPLLFNGTFSAAGSNSRVMTFAGTNTGANEFQNAMANPIGGGILTVAKTDTGTWTLSGANTYTGNTNINQGTLNVATIADSGSSNLGLGTVIRIGSTSITGTLNYTGTGSTTGRTVTIGTNSATAVVGDTGGATITNNGGGALVFTAANFNTTGLTGSLAPSRTLTLGGASTDANEIQGVIADGLTGTMATNLTKANAGTWRLSGANNYTGTTTLNGGKLQLNNATNGSLGSGTLILTSGNLEPLNAARTLSNNVTLTAGTVTGSQDLTINGTLTGTGAADRTLTNNLSTGKTLTLNNVQVSDNGTSRNIIFNGTGNTLISGVISNGSATNGIIQMTGTGTLTLSNTGNSYTGGTFAAGGGTLKLGAAGVIPDGSAVTVGAGTVVGTSTLDLNSFSETIAGLSLGRASTTVAGAMANVVNNGGGSPVLTLGGTLTYNAGSVGFENGQATISANLATGATARSFVVNDGSATDDLVITGALQAGDGFNLNGGGTMRLDNAGNNHVSSVVSGGGTLKLGANSVLGTGPVNLLQGGVGTSTLDLNGKTDAVGTTLSLSSATTTALGAANQIIDSAGGGVLQLNGAVTYNSGTATFNNGTTTISASLDLNGADRDFNINDSDQTAQDVVVSGSIQNSTGTAGLTKNNLGTLVLSGASTYTGATQVTAGTLAVNGSLANTSTTVGSGATLQGSGSIGGSVTVQSGGMIAAGNSIESLTTGALSLEAGSIFAYEMNNDAAAGVAGDLTAVTGNLTLDLSNLSILTLGELGTGSWIIGEKLTLISYSGSWNGGLFNYGSTLADDSTINFSGMDWLFNYNDTSPGSNYTGDLTGSSFVTMTAIPEPNVAALLGGLGTLALLRRRRLG